MEYVNNNRKNVDGVEPAEKRVVEDEVGRVKSWRGSQMIWELAGVYKHVGFYDGEQRSDMIWFVWGDCYLLDHNPGTKDHGGLDPRSSH